jgi:hypothetical protein
MLAIGGLYLRFSGESVWTMIARPKEGWGADDAGNSDLPGASSDVPGASPLVHSLHPIDRRPWHWLLHPAR